jgi:hypothetical protein
MERRSPEPNALAQVLALNTAPGNTPLLNAHRWPAEGGGAPEWFNYRSDWCRGAICRN